MTADNQGSCKTCEVLANRIAELERKLACSRAEAIEDAINILNDMQLYTAFDAVEPIRSLATAPSGYVCVPVEPTDEMVNAFLTWPLPKDFSPDCGVYFKPKVEATWITPEWPSGTNLLTASQAREMLAHVLDAARGEK